MREYERVQYHVVLVIQVSTYSTEARRGFARNNSLHVLCRYMPSC